MAVRACAFDAYGTLFDVMAAARRAVEEPEFRDAAAKWEALAEDWRARQLQYAWLRTLSKSMASFWQITTDSLDWALERHGLDGNEALRARLLDLYWNIEVYPDALVALQRVRGLGLATAILSNGSKMMLDSAATRVGLDRLLDAVLSVDDVAVYKPSPQVYAMVGERFGCEPREVAFVSANGWDAAAAAEYGFRSLWINRAGAPRERLPGEFEAVLGGLAEVPDRIEAMLA